MTARRALFRAVPGGAFFSGSAGLGLSLGFSSTKVRARERLTIFKRPPKGPEREVRRWFAG